MAIRRRVGILCGRKFLLSPRFVGPRNPGLAHPSPQSSVNLFSGQRANEKMILTHKPAIPVVALHPDAGQRTLDFSSVLFLDIDGVLHPEVCEPHEHFCFAPAFCEIIHSIDPEGTLPIVIMSMWRLGRMQDAGYPLVLSWVMEVSIDGKSLSRDQASRQDSSK